MSSNSFTFPTDSNEGFNSGPPTIWIVFTVLVILCAVGGFISACCCGGFQDRRQVTVEAQLPDGSTVYVSVEDVQPAIYNHNLHNALTDHHCHHQQHVDHHCHHQQHTDHHHTAHMAAVNNSVMASTI